MTNTNEALTDFYAQVLAEALLAADRYGFEQDDDLDGLVRAEANGYAIFRVLDSRAVEVQVTSIDASRSVCRSEQTIKLGDFFGALVADPGYEFLETLDESLTDAFRRAARS